MQDKAGVTEHKHKNEEKLKLQLDSLMEKVTGYLQNPAGFPLSWQVWLLHLGARFDGCFDTYNRTWHKHPGLLALSSLQVSSSLFQMQTKAQKKYRGNHWHFVPCYDVLA